MPTRYFWLILLAVVTCGNAVAEQQWETRFDDPPASARPHTWWHWIHGNVSKEGITKDLEAMKLIGLGGFQAFHIDGAMPRGPVGYMTPEWRTLMTHAVQEADRLGLEMCLHNCAGWSSSGGPWVTPETSMMQIVWTEKKVEGAPADIELEQPKANHDYYRDIAVLAFPTPPADVDGEGFRLENSEAKAGFKRGNNVQPDARTAPAGSTIARDTIIDLSDRLKDGDKLAWQAPAGHWTILRFGYTTTGRTNAPAPVEGRGLECDKLSVAGSDLHWRNSVQKVLDDAGPLVGKTLNNVLIDSYETGEQNWTHAFAEEFKARRGYDVLAYLPTVTGRVVDSVEASERYLWDFRRTIADLFCEKYYGRFADLCHERGLFLSIEPYGGWTGNFHDLEVAAVADVPMGEFWAKRRLDWCEWSVKLASSAAHAMGRKYVGAESFTSAPDVANWSTHPGQLKAQGDYYFAHGLNRVIFHTYAHQPWADSVQPGMTMIEYGMQFNRNDTWFPESGVWMDYLARCQHVLQQGQFVADLCYVWSENAPNQLERRDLLTPRPPAGYDYDAISAKTMMTMQVVEGHLRLPSGMRYRVLVLPNDATMRPAMLNKIQELAEAGAIIVGPRPTASPSLQGYPTCDDQVKQISASLWDSGKVLPKDTSLEQILESQHLLPDFEVQSNSPSTPLMYVHRKIGDVDAYFVSNQWSQAVQAECVFRVVGATPELWQAEDGSKRPASIWRTTSDGRTSVTLRLGAAESVFVVFKQGNTAPPHAVAASGPAGEFLSGGPTSLVAVKRARYGVLDGRDDQWFDVTEQVQEFANQHGGEVSATNGMAGDPAKNSVKQLLVEYAIDGDERSLVLDEGATGSLYQSSTNAQPPTAELLVEAQGINLLTFQGGDYEATLPNGGSKRITVANLPESTEVAGPWSVQLRDPLPSDSEAPSITLDQLKSLSEHEDDEVKYFAGHATYRTRFSLSDDQVAEGVRILLDLGQVEALAQLQVNGEQLGTVWRSPYQVDITPNVRAGENELEVEVTVLWPNRLIGDQRRSGSTVTSRGVTDREIPEWVQKGEPLPNASAKTYSAWRHWLATDDLQPSGLIGPVQLHFGKKVSLP
jgi:hypothetical protein